MKSAWLLPYMPCFDGEKGLLKKYPNNNILLTSRRMLLLFPGSSMGSNRITIELSSGRRIPAVFIAWADEIVKIGDKTIEMIEDLDFDPTEITDVISEI